ncbi:uncharacterized protein [Lepisosteus oculatus]|uniref:uncharacterized protein n=1 Tax=Lepisosteus oculatus TaxID=7918 RepID=UPI0035F501E4
MAPVGEGLELWATVRDLPQELTVISFSAFFIFLILLILCTTCGRQSFELKDTTRTEKPSSQLVRVIKLEDSGSRINPDLKRIMDDEKDNTPRITNQRKPIDFGIEEIFNCSDTAEKQISASQRNSIEMDVSLETATIITLHKEFTQTSDNISIGKGQLFNGRRDKIEGTLKKYTDTNLNVSGIHLEKQNLSAVLQEPASLHNSPSANTEKNQKALLSNDQIFFNNHSSSFNYSSGFPRDYLDPPYESIAEVKEAASRLKESDCPSLNRTLIELHSPLHPSFWEESEDPDYHTVEDLRESNCLPPLQDLNQITVNVMSDIELEKYPEEGGENLHALYATVSKKSKALPKQETSTEEPDCHPPEEEEPAPPVPEKRFDI